MKKQNQVTQTVNQFPDIPVHIIRQLENRPHGKGSGRHQAIRDIAVQLVGNKISDMRSFEVLRHYFPDEDKEDHVIRGLIESAHKLNPTPSQSGKRPSSSSNGPVSKTYKLKAFHPATPEALAAIEVPTVNLSIGDALQELFRPGETICINKTAEQREDNKWAPASSGTFQTFEWWQEFLNDPRRQGFFDCPQGAWIRPNPFIPGTYSGTDKDVVAFRHLLIESDSLTKAQQWDFYQKSGLPIACVIDSGGGSLHAWVKVDAKDADEYKARAAQIYESLAPHGFDPSNKNAARFSRLPGALRDGAKQQLVAINIGAASWEAWEAEAVDALDSELDELLDETMFDENKHVKPARTVFHLAGVSMFREGDVGNVSSLPGAGKSSFLAALIASAVGGDNGRDYLSVTAAENTDGFALIHFDTEQSQEDHDSLMRVAMARAGVAVRPGWLYSHCVTHLSDMDRLRLLERALVRAKKKHGGIYAIILDGVADMIVDPNDPKESFPLVDRLMRLAQEYKTPVIGVLHNNPEFGGQTKMRGHLGAQFQRKSATVINLEINNDGLTTVYTTKTRKKALPKAGGVRFRYDETAGMHVTVYDGNADMPKFKAAEGPDKGAKTLESLAAKIWKKNPDDVKSHTVLCADIAKHEKVSPATAGRRFRAMMKAGVISKTVTGAGEGYILESAANKVSKPDSARKPLVVVEQPEDDPDDPTEPQAYEKPAADSSDPW
ncbi:MAG TPA: AAA family ATPase [Chthoniobacterales bacterium]